MNLVYSFKEKWKLPLKDVLYESWEVELTFLRNNEIKYIVSKVIYLFYYFYTQSPFLKNILKLGYILQCSL